MRVAIIIQFDPAEFRLPTLHVLCNAMMVYANMICNLSPIHLGSNTRFPANELWSRIWEVNETCGIKDIRLSHMTRTNEDTNLELSSQHANILYLIGYLIWCWKKRLEARSDFKLLYAFFLSFEFFDLCAKDIMRRVCVLRKKDLSTGVC